MGRPSKRTPETVKAIVEAIESGAFDHVAAGAAGIGRSAFYQWVREDEEFSHTIELARARARQKAEALVFAHDPKSWLTKGPGKSRADAEGWTEVTRVEHTGADGGPIRSAGPDLSRLSTEELRTLRELTEKAGGG